MRCNIHFEVAPTLLSVMPWAIIGAEKYYCIAGSRMEKKRILCLSHSLMVVWLIPEPMCHYWYLKYISAYTFRPGKPPMNMASVALWFCAHVALGG